MLDAANLAVANTFTAPLKTLTDSVNAASDAEEFTLPLTALVLTVGVALASFYIVYIAPAMFLIGIAVIIGAIATLVSGAMIAYTHVASQQCESFPCRGAIAPSTTWTCSFMPKVFGLH